MYSFPNEAGKPSQVSSPNPSRGKVKREGFHESHSYPSLARETLKRNTEEGNKREVSLTVTLELSLIILQLCGINLVALERRFRLFLERFYMLSRLVDTHSSVFTR